MFEAVHDVTGRGIAAFAAGKPRHEWVLEWPGMVVLVVTAVFWTRVVETALGVGSAASIKECEHACTRDLMKVEQQGVGSSSTEAGSEAADTSGWPRACVRA